MNGFGEALDHAGDGDLVDHLGQLAGAGRAHQLHGLRVTHENRLDPRQRRRVAPGHDAELAVLGPRLASGDRRIDETGPLPRGQLRHLAGHTGRSGGVIDDDGAGAQRRQGRGDDRPHIVVIADAQDEELRARGRVPDRRGEPTARGLRPGLRLAGRAVVAGDLVAALDQMARHGPAHHAQPRESDFHVAPQLVGSIAAP